MTSSPFNGVISIEFFFDVKRFPLESVTALRESLESRFLDNFSLSGFVPLKNFVPELEFADSREAGVPLLRLRVTKGFSGWTPLDER